MTKQPKWEAVTFDADDSRTDRLKVNGGWLYRVIVWNASGARTVATTFVADVWAEQHQTL